MKKLIPLILLAALCLGAMASCGAEYEESRWSETLTDKTLHSVGFSEDMSGEIGAIGSISGMSKASQITQGEKKQLRTVTRGDSHRFLRRLRLTK